MVAEQLFREKGFKATSMRDLATEVGIEPPSLYNHFDSKNAILENICFDLADQFFEAFDLIDHSDDPATRLKKAINGHLAVIIRNMDASVVFLHEWRFLTDDKLTKYKKLRQQYEDKFCLIIEDGIKSNIFKQMDARFYCLTLFSSMNWIYDWYNPDGKYQLNEICDHLYDLIVNGISKTTK